ncbi:MAG TPA: hypothetical protein VF049_00115 [Nocardioidaceae bacterium]
MSGTAVRIETHERQRHLVVTPASGQRITTAGVAAVLEVLAGYYAGLSEQDAAEVNRVSVDPPAGIPTHIHDGLSLRFVTIAPTRIDAVLAPTGQAEVAEQVSAALTSAGYTVLSCTALVVAGEA